MKNKISFYQFGNYQAAYRSLLRKLEYEIITAPPLSKRTLEIGCKYSPESVCIPYKYQLGNYIEAVEKGANILLQIGAGCRFGYYAETQEEILKSLGYKVKFIKLQNKHNNILGLFKRAKEIKPDLNNFDLILGLLTAFYKANTIENVEDFLRKNIGFEKEKGQLEKIFKLFLNEVDSTDNLLSLRTIKKNTLRKMAGIELTKPVNPIKVGVIGELYMLMEPFANFNLEKKLGQKGIEVHRFTTISGELLHNVSILNHTNKLLREAHPYLKYHIYGHGTESVARAHRLVKTKFDGIIHIKPFGCIPEINAMPILHNISRDYKIPIIYFSFDSLTSETGINTRLDAFADMLMMRRKKKT